MKNKAKSIKKETALAIWQSLELMPIEPEPIAYKHRGTTINEDGIRICGRKEFIESVLSHLKELLAYESPTTRIGVSWSELTDKESGAVIPGKYRCTIQVHERGSEAKIMRTRYGMFN